MPFNNDIVAGEQLIRQSIQSPNYGQILVQYSFTDFTKNPTVVEKCHATPIAAVGFNTDLQANFGYQTDPVMGTGPLTNTAPDLGIYFTFTVSEASPILPLRTLKSIRFHAARGGSTGPRGFEIRTSLDNFATVVAADTLVDIRPTFTSLFNFELNLVMTGDSVEIRIYPYVAGAGQSIEIDDITVEFDSRGWTINKDGSAEFQNLKAQGTFEGDTIQVPTNTVVGEPRIFMTSNLPPPLDTYLLNGSVPADVGIIFKHGTASEDDYTFLATFRFPGELVLQLGMVLDGAVVETAPGAPVGQSWNIGGGFNSIIMGLKGGPGGSSDLFRLGRWFDPSAAGGEFPDAWIFSDFFIGGETHGYTPTNTPPVFKVRGIVKDLLYSDERLKIGNNTIGFGEVPYRLGTTNGISVAAFSAETVIATLTGFGVLSGETYRVTALINCNASVATDTYDIRVREDNIAGTVVRGGIDRVTVGTTTRTVTVIREFEATATASNKVFVVTMGRSSGGTGTANTFSSQSRYTIDHVQSP